VKFIRKYLVLFYFFYVGEQLTDFASLARQGLQGRGFITIR